MRGGYQILDFKKLDIASEQYIKGVYDKIEGGSQKAVLLENVVVDNIEKPDSYYFIRLDGTNYILYNGDLEIIVTDEDIVFWNDNRSVYCNVVLYATELTMTDLSESTDTYEDVNFTTQLFIPLKDIEEIVDGVVTLKSYANTFEGLILYGSGIASDESYNLLPFQEVVIVGMETEGNSITSGRITDYKGNLVCTFSAANFMQIDIIRVANYKYTSNII